MIEPKLLVPMRAGVRLILRKWMIPVLLLQLVAGCSTGADPPRNVILIGVDCDYVVERDEIDADGCVFTSKAADRNHFHPDYFGKGFRFHDPMVERMLQAYAKARAVFDAHGRRVLNATLGGKLEIFERVDYASLF